MTTTKTRLTIRRNETRTVLYFITESDAMAWAKQLAPGARLGACGHIHTAAGQPHMSIAAV